MQDCVFCRIAGGVEPSSTVHEDDVVMVIMTIRPVNPGHAMVNPKRHCTYLADMDDATGRHLFSVTMRTAQAIRDSGLRCEGINLFLADGRAAFQEVFHVHMHVFPRFAADGFKIVADWSVHPPRSELDATAALIRRAYERLQADGR